MRRHLAAVQDAQDASRAVQISAARLQGMVLGAALSTPRPAPRIRLTDWQRLEVEQTRKLLIDAPDLFGTRPAEYVAGLIEGAASNLLDILDSVCEP
jgi:hypothetical protein